LRIIGIALAGLLALSSCQKMEETGPAAQPKREDAVAASKLLIARKTSHLDFLWRAPAELAGARLLLQQMRNDALNDARQMAEDAAACAANDAETPTCRYYRLENWEVTASTPGLLAIAAKSENYTGGAHPNAVWKAVIWDRKAERAIEAPALFTDWSRAEPMLEAAYCRALDAERTDRRGVPVDGTGPFDECPPLASHPVVPVAGPWTGVHSLRVLLSPYEAGPYAEGSYEIDVPVTDELKALMKPEYLPKG
jgi:hypothetical protein